MSQHDEVFSPLPSIRVLHKGYGATIEPSRPITHEPTILGTDTGAMTNEDALLGLSLPYIEELGESCYAQYMHYLHGYSGNICDDARGVLMSNPHLESLMQCIAQYKEVVSVGSLLLYGQAETSAINDPETEVSRPRSWYNDTIDQCSEALAHISGFTDKLYGLSSDTAFTAFVNDFQKEIELLIVDTVNLATGTAAHLTRSNCAVFIGELPVQVPEKANFGNIFSLFGGHSGKKMTVYDRYLGGSLEYLRTQKKELDAGKTNRTIQLPALVSAFDTAEFATLLNQFFAEAEHGVSTIAYDPETDSFKLGNGIEVSIKPNGRQNAQPRINFRGVERFKGFSLRIDKEDERLAMDIGGYGYATLIKISEAIAKATQNGESIMDYPEIANDKDYRLSSRILYTPVNKNPGIPKISQGEFMAYVGAFCMAISHQMGIRRTSSYFSYHSRSFLATNPDHHTHFAANAATLYDTFKTLADTKSQ